MRRALAILWCWTIASQAAVQIERRAPGSVWRSSNSQRVRTGTRAAAGLPVWLDLDLPGDFDPDTVRVFRAGEAMLVPAKTEWRQPNARIQWKSAGPGDYEVYFDVRGKGETERLAAPAMVGAGDRVTFGRSGVKGALAVGLWAYPAAFDYDGDGDTDLIVSCPDHPYNGTYLFRNLKGNAGPLYDRGEWIGRGYKEMNAADFNGDGALDLVVSGGYFSDVRRNLMRQFVRVVLNRDYHVGRDDAWYPVDWDHDGKIDLLTGVSDWRDYGWDDAFDERGRWTRGPLHGYVYFHRNRGTNEKPDYEHPVRLKAGGVDIDQYGSPAPQPADWFGSGRLDLILGNFIDRVFVARNLPNGLQAPQPLLAAGQAIRLDLCMIQPRVVRWHADGRPSLLVAEEDGTISLFENQAPYGKEPALAAGVKLMQIDPYVKSGALSRPLAADWNGDGKLDLVAGNSAGYIQWFENTGSRAEPRFTGRGYLEADGKPIRRVAGPNGSVQGPAEEKWGYANPWIVDWDLDGKQDVLVNDIWGSVVWYRNTGTAQNPVLAAAHPVEVDWKGVVPKPDWVWWQPSGGQLVTQWRTTPRAIDWDGDGLPDLVMLNHQGYLALFRRVRTRGSLHLLPPERIFVDGSGRFLNLAGGRAGRSGRRKLDFADWDGDGDLDLISDSEAGPAWYENTGTQARPVLQFRGPLMKTPIAGHNPTPNVADWNGDGRPDLLVGAEDGFFYFYERSYLDSQR